MWRGLRGAALSGALMLGAAWPALAQDQVVRFVGPTGGAVKALVEDIIPAFEEKTGIKVEGTFMAHEALTQKAMTEFVTGQPSFDVIQFETSWGGRYSPFLDDLEPHVEEVGADYQADDILAAARNMGIYEGKSVGLPYRVIGRMLHYRTDLFEQAGISAPPQTMAELLEDAKKLNLDTDGDGEVDVYGFGFLGKQGFGNAYEFGSFLFSGGGAWWDLEGCTVEIASDASLRAWDFYDELRNGAGVMPPEVTTWAWDEWIAAGQNGRYAMTIMHTPYAVPLSDPEKSKTAGKWGWADAPGFDSLEQGSPPVGGWLLGMTTGGENKDAAWEFIKFATGPEAQLMSAFNANAPTRGSVFKDPKVKEIWPWADVALRSLDRGTPMYNNPEELEAESALMVKVSEVLIDAGEPADVAPAAADELTAILKESGRCE